MGTEARKLQGEVDRLQQELQTLKAQYHSEDEELITISDYILKRLEQLNVTVCVPFNHVHRSLLTYRYQSIFGVPGDFNMRMVSSIIDNLIY